MDVTHGRPTTHVGFGPDVVEFYEGLEQDNSRDWWSEHKDVYDAQVRAPLEALAQELQEEFGPAKVFRPNRDVRFSADKRPYKLHAAMAVAGPAGTALYLQVGADGLLLAGGLYAPAPDQLDRLRHAIDAGPAATELDDVVARAAQAGLGLSDGDPVRTAPRGWPRDHPRIDLLRRRSLTLGTEHESGPWWSSPQLLAAVQDAWRAMVPLNAWCERHVGASTAPPRRGPGAG